MISCRFIAAVRGAPLAAVALLAALAACDGSTGSGTRVPARMDVVSGNGQTADPGAELAQPLVVRVVDDKDRPVRGQIVNFVVTEGGGSVFAGAALTNADGEARERWRLGTSPGQTVEARAVDAATGQAVVFATFTAKLTGEGVAFSASRAGPAGPGPLLALPGAAVADSLAVGVSDRYGRPVAGVAVAWAADNGAAVSPATSTTGANGIARTRLTLGTANVAYTATGTAAGIAPVQFAAQVLVPATLMRTFPGPQLEDPLPAPGALPANWLGVRVLSAQGVPLPGVTVTYTVTGGGGSIAPAQVVTNAQGYAEAVFTTGPQEFVQNTATATVPGLTPATFSFVTKARVPFGSVLVIPDTLRIPVGGVDTLRARVRDASGAIIQQPGPMTVFAPTHFTFSWQVRVAGFLETQADFGTYGDDASLLRVRATAPGQGWVVGRLSGVPYWVTGAGPDFSVHADSTYVIVQ